MSVFISAGAPDNIPKEVAMDQFMRAAYEEALKGLNEGGIPIGAVLVHKEKIIGRGHNQRIQKGSPILHGEMDAYNNAGRLPASIYRECVLYTTLSPCIMCTGATLLFKIPKVVIGDEINFVGASDMLRAKGVDVQVTNEPELVKMMRTFIAEKPTVWDEDIAL